MPSATAIDTVSMVEACHHQEPDHAAWLAGFVSAAKPLLGYGFGHLVALIEERSVGREVVLCHSDGLQDEFMRTNIDVLKTVDAASYRAAFYPASPTAFASTHIEACFGSDMRDLYLSLQAPTGAEDSLGTYGHPFGGFAFFIGSLVGRRADVTSAKRRALERVRVHLETALRLRWSAAVEPVAVLTPAGKLLHADTQASASTERALLATQVDTIERVRSGGRHDPESVAAWRALVDGLWSVVERRESDGKRLYYAYENASRQGYAALSPREAQLIELSAQGLTGKEVAYALGVSEGSVSRGLASAATRLGLSSAHALVRLAAGLLRTSDEGTAALSTLSASERAVMGLVCEGHSNQRIAELRGVSVRTIANQVASILDKTQMSGRRGLLSMAQGD